MTTIGKSKTIGFSVTATPADQIVIIFSGKHTGETYQSFSYPARTGYTTLAKDGYVFSGTLTEAATKSAKSDLLIADIKAWSAAGLNTIKQVEFANMADTKVKALIKVA
jgi:hypothetical protein